MGKLVVLGANGFIGKHLVAGLAKASPNNTIVAFDKFADYQKGTDHPFDAYKNVTIVPGDFFNRSSVSSALEDASYVFHLISTTTPATANDDPFIDVDTNVRGSVELFSLCVEHNVKKVIFVSSGGAVYGEINSDTIDETLPPAPRSPYGIGKLAIEHYLRYFKFTAGLDYVVFRAGNPYGPGQNIYGKQGVIPIFMHHFLKDEPLTIFGKGDMMRDYIYIDDLIAMMVGSYDKPNKHSEYNLGSGKGETVNELVELIEKCVGHAAKKEYLPTPSTFIQKNALNIDRFVQEFDIKPIVSLKDGIARTWDYVKKLD